MTIHYRAFYPAVEAALVTNADAKRFPLRDTAHKAAEDARRFWHTQGEKIVPYQIGPDGKVTELQVRTYLETEVVESP